MDYLKAEQTGPSRWRVLAIPFGGPLKGGRDLDGEFFSPRTDVKSQWFKERPVLWHHGGDDSLGDAALGTQGELSQEPDGWWADMWLDRSSRYWALVDGLLRAGKVFGSSGSLSHLVRKARDGEILVWPHIEQTLTPTPANPFARVVASKAVGDFTSAGIAIEPALRDLIASLDSLTDLHSDLSGPAKAANDGDDVAKERLARLEALRDQLAAL